MQAMTADQYLNATLEVRGVHRDTLRHLVSYVTPAYSSVALVGFNDYAKHLINLFPDQIVLVLDPDPAYQGISFRGVNVVAELEGEVDLFIMTEYDYLYTAITHIEASLQQGVPIRMAPSYDGQSGKVISPEHHLPFYRELFAEDERRSVGNSSMMSRTNIVFLIELLQSTIHLDGAVAEIGVWQGGSAQYLAKTLAKANSDKPLYLLDFFEDHEAKHPKGIMCIDELERNFSFYRNTEFLVGDIRETVKKLSGGKFCFVHYDMGYQRPILDAIVPGLSPGGIILLDNYGHLAAKPALFDQYFEQNYGLHICRVPYTQQALLINSQPQVAT